VRLRRKSGSPEGETAATEAAETGTDREAEVAAGPYDAEDLPDDGQPRLDLGALLVPPADGKELRVQVDQASGSVRAVMLAASEGALELRAYAAPRNGDLWSEIRPQIAADATRKGGSAVEREGRFGTELVCELQVSTKDGAAGTQTSRVIGINGPRWLLRATLIGKPAREPETAADWEDVLTKIAVRRGGQPMPVGEQLPLVLPEDLRRSGADAPAE